MDLNELNPRSLKAEDFADGPQTLTITGFEVKEFPTEGGGTDRRGCFYFKETPHYLVSNKTNNEAIIAATGEKDTDNMLGKQITLRKTKTQFGSKQVDCIRLAEQPF
jgi:hypothetical protein